MSETSRCVGFLLALFAGMHVHAHDESGAGVYRDPAAWELFEEEAPLASDALARFDSRELGGNDDGWITPADAVWPRLRLWQDLDADGVAARGELRALAGLGLRALTLASNCSGIQSPHEGHARVHVQLVEHLPHLRLDRVHRDTAPGRDLRDRPAFAELLRDVGFGAAEFRHGGHDVVVPWPAPGRHLCICADAAHRPLGLSW
jgi:hypothetical protein